MGCWMEKFLKESKFATVALNLTRNTFMFEEEVKHYFSSIHQFLDLAQNCNAALLYKLITLPA